LKERNDKVTKSRAATKITTTTTSIATTTTTTRITKRLRSGLRLTMSNCHLFVDGLFP